MIPGRQEILHEIEGHFGSEKEAVTAGLSLGMVAIGTDLDEQGMDFVANLRLSSEQFRSFRMLFAKPFWVV